MATIHPLSDVKSDSIGDGTRIWQFVVVLNGAKIGKDCNICAHTLIEGKVVIGDRVTIKSGVYIWDNTIIENDVFIGPCVAFTNDKYPRSKEYNKEFESICIKEGASIGANVTILPGITIGKKSIVGAGSVVTKNIPDYAIAYGNPVKITRAIENES
ncbi:N-acetyltransferase [Escherichia coli]|uniref:acyltransferase n=1 Tax=Escherichia coli TaxID=562 RepID=UPI000CF0F7C9|nr:acyltransferase [Escherichia coli]EEV9321792.1 N-acetyltransferase [Escherichia coli]EEW5975201.1 N-acetyltransferase [Escherichia coli]EFB9761465.1 N-acetyltransferase [Escherichia coli]EFJ2085536.1 N-acetyltransferase [Escherichia coli]EGI3097928.1 N-acetyltransferase [Escherichia coli]